MNEEREDVIRRLGEYRDEIQRLMDLLGNRTSLSAAEREELRAGYRTLKERVRAEHRAGSTARGEAALNETERRYLQPAVMRAAVDLSAAVNTDPLQSEWFSCLYCARLSVTQFLSQLEPDE